MYSFDNLDSALIGMSQELVDKGQHTLRRGKSVIELPYPIIIELTNPLKRFVTLPARKWNYALPYLESLWMLKGWNNLDDLPGRYVKNLYKFSDDGTTWRGGYGPRLRYYDGSTTQYDISAKQFSMNYTVDQLKYVVQILQKDPTSRQAIISIGDPMKDSFDSDRSLLETKDYPCTRSLHFMMRDGKLNCYTHMRSNDILWGFSAVNVSNFAFMQEYVASVLGVPIGSYYHLVDNFHVYEEFFGKIWRFSKLKPPIDSFVSRSVMDRAKISLHDLDMFVTKILEHEEHYFEFDFSPLDYDWNKLNATVPEYIYEWDAVIALKNIERQGELIPSRLSKKLTSRFESNGYLSRIAAKILSKYLG